MSNRPAGAALGILLFVVIFVFPRVPPARALRASCPVGFRIRHKSYLRLRLAEHPPIIFQTSDFLASFRNFLTMKQNLLLHAPYLEIFLEGSCTLL